MLFGRGWFVRGLCRCRCHWRHRGLGRELGRHPRASAAVIHRVVRAHRFGGLPLVTPARRCHAEQGTALLVLSPLGRRFDLRARRRSRNGDGRGNGGRGVDLRDQVSTKQGERQHSRDGRSGSGDGRPVHASAANLRRPMTRSSNAAGENSPFTLPPKKTSTRSDTASTSSRGGLAYPPIASYVHPFSCARPSSIVCAGTSFTPGLSPPINSSRTTSRS